MTDEHSAADAAQVRKVLDDMRCALDAVHSAAEAYRNSAWGLRAEREVETIRCRWRRIRDNLAAKVNLRCEKGACRRRGPRGGVVHRDANNSNQEIWGACRDESCRVASDHHNKDGSERGDTGRWAIRGQSTLRSISGRIGPDGGTARHRTR